LRLVLAGKNALLFRVMTNKAFTTGFGLTRNGPNEGDFLARLRAACEENFAGRKAAPPSSA
jgi:hypothetical protein